MEFFGDMNEIQKDGRRIFQYNPGTQSIMKNDTIILARKIQSITVIWKQIL